MPQPHWLLSRVGPVGYQGGMRTSEIDILIVPGLGNAGTEHWQARWERQLKTARRVEQAEWERPACLDWVERIVAAVEAATRPAVIVAHGYGVIAVAHAAPRLVGAGLAGAFLVAPPDLEGSDAWPATAGGFAPTPMRPLPFPTKLVGSSTDPHSPAARTQELGAAWGSDVSLIANAGHIDADSDHGPWPEGLLTFGLFLKKLG